MDKSTKKNKDVAAREAAETTPSPEAKRKPEKTFRVEDCSATIWPREIAIKGQQKVFRTISFERSYKDRDGAWRYTKSFDPESLGKIVSLCQQASEYLSGLQLEAA